MKFDKLRYPKEIKKTILGMEVEIKNYLTTGEINSIVEQMLEYDNYIQREMVRGLCILKFCTNIEVDDENYDLYRANKIISVVMDEINEEDLLLIDETICNKESINKIIKDFCNGIDRNLLETKPDKMMEELVSDLKDLQEKQNAI